MTAPAPASLSHSLGRWLGGGGFALLLGACSPTPPTVAPSAMPPAVEPAPALPTVPPGSGWVLDAAESSLGFVSVKNDKVAESHRFTDFSAEANLQGQVRLTVRLASVQTGVDLRDERLRTLLFEVGRYATATLSASIDARAVAVLAVGADLRTRTEATLDLHGHTAALPLGLRVTRLDAGRWLVTSETPAIVDATRHDLAAGIEALRAAVNLNAIASGVPVNFALVFRAR